MWTFEDIRVNLRYEGGIGAFATRDIDKGELLLREPPIVTATLDTLEAAVAGLDEARRKKLFSLCDWRAERDGTEKTALGVFQANGYPAPTKLHPENAGLFLEFSRFNHACKPNVHHARRRRGLGGREPRRRRGGRFLGRAATSQPRDAATRAAPRRRNDPAALARAVVRGNRLRRPGARARSSSSRRAT